MEADYLKAVGERVVIFDGGTGTGYQRMGLGPDDFGGEEFEGCNELLNITRPDAVAALHASYLDVGVDVIETNTFGAFAIPLAEYGIAQRTYEIAKSGAEIASRWPPTSRRATGHAGSQAQSAPAPSSRR